MPLNKREILENHAFMANVIKIGSYGVEFHQWIRYLNDEIGGFIGDVKLSPLGGYYRVVMAAEDTKHQEQIMGGDVPQKMVARLNDKFSRLEDDNEAFRLSSLVKELRDGWLKGDKLECSIAGDELELDFVRGRHVLKNTQMLEALHVHGLTLIGETSNPDMIIENVSEQGVCMYADGRQVPFKTVAEIDYEAIIAPSVGLNVHGVKRGVYEQIAKLVVRNSFKKLNGPEPSGILISSGEDGNLMIVGDLSKGHIEGDLSVKFLPKSIQIFAGKEIIAQAQHGLKSGAIMNTQSEDVCLANFDGKNCKTHKCKVM